jgi:hypothetical protein
MGSRTLASYTTMFDWIFDVDFDLGLRRWVLRSLVEPRLSSILSQVSAHRPEGDGACLPVFDQRHPSQTDSPLSYDLGITLGFSLGQRAILTAGQGVAGFGCGWVPAAIPTQDKLQVQIIFIEEKNMARRNTAPFVIPGVAAWWEPRKHK